MINKYYLSDDIVDWMAVLYLIRKETSNHEVGAFGNISKEWSSIGRI